MERLTTAKPTVPFADQERAPAVMPWWLLLLLGLFTLLFGILILATPRNAPGALANLLGLYWLLTGILLFVSIFLDRNMTAWKVTGGILGVVAGLLILNHPAWSPALGPALPPLLIGAAGIGVGVANLVLGLRRPDWGLGAAGILDIVLGVLVLLAGQVAFASSPILLGVITVAGALVIIIRSFI